MTDKRSRRPLRRHLIALCGGALLLAALAALVAADAPRVIYRSRSPYNEIIVTESERGRRVLLFEPGGDEQSSIDLLQPEALQADYTKAITTGLALIAPPRRALMIGVGGGSVASYLHRRLPELDIDCVDIDAEVVAVAQRFFRFSPDARMRVHIADGRRFVEQSRDRYDLIILDAYNSDDVPLHLTTAEYLRAVQQRVAPRGVVVSNLICEELNRLYPAMLRTFQEVFADVYSARASRGYNCVVFAFNEPRAIAAGDLRRELLRLDRERSFGFDPRPIVVDGWRHETVRAAGVRVLRDAELAPASLPASALKTGDR
ncbi:MAG: fused MFS/spermidine synthase [Deltaproteobacteria bacterium]|nr:fused MFS/spermidine synthase [Deltaproteobacteria bacterium]